MSDHVSAVRDLISALNHLGRKRSYLDMRKKDWRALLQGGRVHDAVCRLQRFYDDEALPSVAFVNEETIKPRESWCKLGELAGIELGKLPNPENMTDLDGWAEEHVDIVLEWALAENARLTSDQSKKHETKREAICQQIEYALSKQALKLFLFLKDCDYSTDFRSLADQEGLWRGNDEPTYEAIEKALKRLRDRLNALKAPIHVQICKSDKRTKLEFLESGKGR